MAFVTRLFDPKGFPARWQCGSGWSETPWLGWLHIISDLGVWGAYLAIPLVLLYFLQRRRDLPFRKIFLLFGAFILACGTTHLMEAIIFWQPLYRLAGVIKLLTAIVSWATVVSLFQVVPRVLTMRTPEELEREIAARKLAEEQLHRVNSELEERVEQRTADLTQANTALCDSERREKERATELKKSEEALKEADRRKDEFLAILAHELRNPLAPIRNSLEVMKRVDGNSPLMVQSRGTMERQIGQMVRLIDDLLDVSRISRNKLELRKERVEFASVISHVVETCRPLAERANLRLTVNMPSEPVVLDADPVRLAQVFDNLLTNACKYTESGGQIWVDARTEGSDLVVSVKDTGIGIAAEWLPRVFEMFIQIDRSLERTQGGLGIGLTLVKRLVEMHHGSVTATSPGPGLGSEFIVRLPRLVIPVREPVAAGPETENTITGRRILVVDDNHDSATTLSMLLRMAGNDVQMAHDGLEALDAAERLRPQIILLDIGLPHRNGYEVCSAIRDKSWGREVVIVALTCWGQEEDRRKSKQAGFDGHLVKPVEYGELMAILTEPKRTVGAK